MYREAAGYVVNMGMAESLKGVARCYEAGPQMRCLGSHVKGDLQKYTAIH